MRERSKPSVIRSLLFFKHIYVTNQNKVNLNQNASLTKHKIRLSDGRSDKESRSDKLHVSVYRDKAKEREGEGR